MIMLINMIGTAFILTGGCAGVLTNAQRFGDAIHEGTRVVFVSHSASPPLP